MSLLPIFYLQCQKIYNTFLDQKTTWAQDEQKPFSKIFVHTTLFTKKHDSA